MKPSEGQSKGIRKKKAPARNLKPQPKQKIPRDKKYLAWVKTLPCIECQAPGPSEPHHTETGGTGIKGSDYSAVPLCNKHHQEWHNTKGKKGGLSKATIKGVTGRIKALYDDQQKGKDEGKQSKEDEPLTDKEDWFCREFVADASENQTRAYLRVYKCENYDTAKSLASRLFTKVNIKARVAELRAERNKRLELSADRVLAELVKLSFYDPRDFFDVDGKLKPINELDPDHAAVIAGIETIHKVVGDDKDGMIVTTKIKLPNKNESLEKLGKNLMLWKDPGSKDNPLTGNVSITMSKEDIAL